MDDADIKRIIEAANKTADARVKTSIETLTKELKQSSLSAAQYRNLNLELKKLGQGIFKNNEDLKAFNKSVDDATDRQIALSDASKKLEQGLYASYKASGLSSAAATEAAEQHKKATEFVKAFGSAAYKGSGKIDEYTAVFKGRLGGIGDLIAGAGSRLETNVDAFRTLSSVGASFGQTLVTLRETAASAGLPLEDFTKLIKQNSETLALLYGSTTLGAKQFSRLSESFRRTNLDTLMPLGFTVDEINSVLLTNLNMQRRTGQLVEGADEQQIMSSRSFALELDKMSKLTGIQRSELAKQIESQTKNERFLAFLNTTTDETRQRLQTFAGSVEGISPALAEGLQDLIANAGVPVTQASKMLVMNIPEATSVVRDLTNGTISSSEALLRMRDAAQRSNQSLGAVAQTGTVEFARLYGDVNKLAKAKLNETAVSQEQAKRATLLTSQLTEFQDASKRLSSQFQSLETGFLGAMGDTIGVGLGGINKGMNVLSAGISGMNNASKALLFAATSIGSFVLDKATQVGVVFSGTYSALKAAGMGKGGMIENMKNMFGASKDTAKKMLPTDATSRGVKAGKFGLGALATGFAASAVGNDNIVGKGLDVASYALTGATIGSMFPGIGTAIGAGVGTLMGVVNQLGGVSALASGSSRATGTYGETGLPFEAKTSMLKVHAGERVLNPQETADYNKSGPDAGQTQYMMEYNQTAKQLLEATKATNALLNKQVAIAMATEKNTKKTSKVVDKVGPSIV